jgi:RNA polymerase sigma-70 factor (ECF subfamily)
VTDSDQNLVEHALRGDEDAFAQIVEKYQKPVFNLCYRMLGSAVEAEDAAQESFWRAYQALNRYDQTRPFLTWLLSIAAHYCIDQQRRRRVPLIELDSLPFDTIPDAAPIPEKVAAKHEEQRVIYELLDKLGPQDRAAVILRYWYDLSEDEISQSLSLTVSAVKSRLHRARKELADLYVEKTKLQNSKERRQYEPSAV